MEVRAEASAALECKAATEFSEFSSKASILNAEIRGMAVEQGWKKMIFKAPSNPNLSMVQCCRNDLWQTRGI